MPHDHNLKNGLHLSFHAIKIFLSLNYLKSFKEIEKNRSKFTGSLFFFRISIDVVIIISYFLIYIFYFYHDKNHNENAHTSALADERGMIKLLWGTTARTMWISIISEEIILYYFSVRVAKERSIYQEFNLKEKYWRKGEENPRLDIVMDNNKLDELKY